MSTGSHVIDTLLMIPFIAWGVLLGIETAIGYWVRWATQRPAPV